MNEFGWNNALQSHEKVAYIVGEGYDILSALPCVLTIMQFKIAVLEQRLPAHRLWIIGQGLTRDDVNFLRLCEKHLQRMKFHLSSHADNFIAKSPSVEYVVENHESMLEWNHFHFIDSTRVQAELKIAYLSESLFLAQDFLFAAARELTERACQSALPDGVLVIKQAGFHSFHRLFPLPITVETKFQLSHDNKRSLKSLTRFYQDYACTAEVTMLFDFYSKEEADVFYRELAEKTIEHLSDQL